jgi:hypothetical protein
MTLQGSSLVIHGGLVAVSKWEESPTIKSECVCAFAPFLSTPSKITEVVRSSGCNFIGVDMRWQWSDKQRGCGDGQTEGEHGSEEEV